MPVVAIEERQLSLPLPLGHLSRHFGAMTATVTSKWSSSVSRPSDATAVIKQLQNGSLPQKTPVPKVRLSIPTSRSYKYTVHHVTLKENQQQPVPELPKLAKEEEPIGKALAPQLSAPISTTNAPGTEEPKGDVEYEAWGPIFQSRHHFLGMHIC